MIVKENNIPQTGQDVTMMICWFNERPMRLGGKYGLKHTTRDARCIIKEVNYKVDINTLAKVYDDNEIGLNEIGQITIRATQPLLYDSYRKNRITGSLILIDEGTNETVGAGMII
jgi:sulfate adenylyltransferase subunit 1